MNLKILEFKVFWKLKPFELLDFNENSVSEKEKTSPTKSPIRRDLIATCYFFFCKIYFVVSNGNVNLTCFPSMVKLFETFTMISLYWKSYWNENKKGTQWAIALFNKNETFINKKNFQKEVENKCPYSSRVLVP